jgi:hypothetical protein
MYKNLTVTVMFWMVFGEIIQKYIIHALRLYYITYTSNGKIFTQNLVKIGQIILDSKAGHKDI